MIMKKDTLLSKSINANQLAAQVNWQKEIFGTSSRIMAYQSIKNNYATRSIKIETEKDISNKTNIMATFNYRSQPLNLIFIYFSQILKNIIGKILSYLIKTFLHYLLH